MATACVKDSEVSPASPRPSRPPRAVDARAVDARAAKSFEAGHPGHQPLGTRMAEFLAAPGDGSAVETVEFAMYHFDNTGLITHVEVTADNARLTTR